METKKEFKKHALLGPSASHRWLHCTPSAVAEAAVADEGSTYAAEGSMAHALCAMMLNDALNRDTKEAEQEIEELVMTLGEPTDEMDQCAQTYSDFVLDLYEKENRDGGAEIHIETLLDLSTWAPESFGTSDAVVVGPDTIHVIDFKYGKGVEVSAVENPQMRLYALGALEEFGVTRKIEKVVTHIWQPRIGNYSHEEIAVKALVDWGSNYMWPLANVAYRGLGVRNAGPWCKFCSASRGCRALDEYAIIASATPVESMSAEGIGNVCLPMIGPLEQWIDDVKGSALRYMLDGTPVPGYKVVESRSKRVVSEPEKLAEVLRGLGYADELFMKEPELRTLTALEKLVGKKQFAEVARECLTKAPGKPTVVPDTDRRSSYNPGGAFDNIKIE